MFDLHLSGRRVRPRFVKPFVLRLGESPSTNGLFIVNTGPILKQALMERAATLCLKSYRLGNDALKKQG